MASEPNYAPRLPGGEANHPGVIRHVPELDGVRGIAILLVLALHFYEPFWRTQPLGPLGTLLKQGWIGVDLFFVLSGFLITSILIEVRQRAHHYFRNFYARRALRILPLYYVSVAAFFWLVVPTAHHFGWLGAIGPYEQLWYWSFLQNWRIGLGFHGSLLSHFWSLGVEEQFYLLWSVVVWLLPPKKLTAVCLALLPLTLALRLALQHAGLSEDLIGRMTITRMDTLAMGALIATSPRIRGWVARAAIWAVPLGLALTLVPLIPRSVIYSTNAAAAGCLVARASQAGVRALRSGWLIRFGRYSYAIYVLHYLVLHAPAALFAARFGGWIAALIALLAGTALSYALAALSWHVIEEPFLRLKRHFRYR